MSHTIPHEFPILRWELTRNRLSRFSVACGMSRSEGTIHDDEEDARAVGLTEPIGYGMLSAAILSRAITDVIGAGNVRRLHTRFVRPAWVGETLETHITAHGVKEMKDGVTADLVCHVNTTTGEERVRGTATITVPTVHLLEHARGQRGDPSHDEAEGPPGGGSLVVVERSAVANFANSVDENNLAYFDVNVAKTNHPQIPAPPTFGLDATLQYWGQWRELQPERSAHDAMELATTTLERLAGPGLIVHAEQLFEYRRPIYVGDVLLGTSKMGAPLTKVGRKGRLTFLDFRSRWSDYRTGDVVMTSCMTLVAPREYETGSTP